MAQITNIPPEASDLGAPVSEQSPNALQRGFWFALWGCLFFLGLLLSGAALFVLIVSSSSDGPSSLVLGLLMVLGGAIGFGWLWRKRDFRVIVFEKGLSYTTRGKTEIIRWDDVAHIRQNIPKVMGEVIFPTSNPSWTEIKLKDGRQFKLLGGFTNPGELGTVIRAGVMQSLTSAAAEAYSSGKAISFGPLTVSQAGIGYLSRTLAWEHMGDVDVNEGKLTIRQKFGPGATLESLIWTEGRGKKWCTVKSEQVPNLMLFLKMVGAVTQAG